MHAASPARGDFPSRADSGYGTRTPVGAHPANDFGLHDMAGDVWEWTTDWYAVPADPDARIEDSYDPAQPQFRIPRRVVKGGSYLCAGSYCLRYRPAARRPQMVDSGMSHIGFRCVLRPASDAPRSAPATSPSATAPRP